MRFRVAEWLGLTILLSSGWVFAQQSQLVSQPKQQVQEVETSGRDRSVSDELNDHLPRWLSFSGEIRLRGEGFTGAGFKSDRDDAYLLTRLRLTMKVQPTSWLKFVFQGQDAHVLGESLIAPAQPYQDTMDLRLGYIELGDMEKKKFSFRAGRQELAFGEERLLGNANWLNTPRSFDGFRSTLRGAAYRLDAFAACIDKVHDGQFNECTPGNNIYGLYGGLPKLVPQATVEPYFLWRRQSHLKTESGSFGVMNQGTVGFRWAGNLLAGFDYDTEMAKQAGSLGSDTISAWAGHWRTGYTIAHAHFTPRLVAEFNYATGDHNSKDGRRGTFDQIYPSAHDLYGLTDQVGWKNIQHVRMGVDIKPAAKWKLSSKYSSYWLADPHDALYSAASVAIVKSATGTAGRYVGQELDFVAFYNFNKRAVFACGFGHLSRESSCTGPHRELPTVSRTVRLPTRSSPEVKMSKQPEDLGSDDGSSLIDEKGERSIVPGKVYFVGAGPGDPELLTLKAARLLRNADIVLRDELVNDEVLGLIPRCVPIYNVGKRCGRASSSQEDANFLMISLALSGMQVVRLKGGDPSVFGRLGEEIVALEQANIEFEIIPGITAALGAASAAAIPMTHRQVSHAVVFVTGHSAGESELSSWDALVSLGATIVIYMPGYEYSKFALRLQAAGLSLDTPCVIVSRASTREQQLYWADLEKLPHAPRLPAPTVLVIGKVLGHAGIRSAPGLGLWLPDLPTRHPSTSQTEL